jgi:predicted O-methyltransferase YrrM
MQELWGTVDDYINTTLIGTDEALDGALAASDAAGLPPISVTPNQGKFLMLLARIRGARSILEIGTLGGYSTIWLARGLVEGGRLITLEADPRHAEVARENFARAGLSRIVHLREGRAQDTLPELAAEGTGPFDLVFIDADKPGNPDYFKWALRLTKPGSVIVVDNVVRDGEVADPKSTDPAVKAVRKLNELLAAEKRVSATELQTVGSKGYDGFAIAVVNEHAT